jgi:site-specific recombinase XerD
MLAFMETSLSHFLSRRTSRETVKILTHGPLSPHVAVYAQRLKTDGYAFATGQSLLLRLARFSKWLDQKRIGANRIDPSTIEQYLRFRKKAGKSSCYEGPTLTEMLQILRPGQTSAPSPAPTAGQVVLEQFQNHLRHEHGLCEGTIKSYSHFVKLLLTACPPSDALDFHHLCPDEITAFVRRQAIAISSSYAVLITTALRSFLRYLLYRGAIGTNLAACVPTVASWSLSNVPRFLPADQIQRVIDSCDRKSVTGKRDYCILLLLARLGLRAGEVVKLTLDDIDWEAGIITIQGKGKRAEQMPLPVEVGAAMADYLQNARPTCSDRRVFIRRKAPLVSLGEGAVFSIVDWALKNAGVESAHRGPHVFRHSLATTMLKKGASLAEIGDLLRHRHPDTTAIYAKVDLTSLRSIALPWPGGDR